MLVVGIVVVVAPLAEVQLANEALDTAPFRPLLPALGLQLLLLPAVSDGFRRLLMLPPPLDPPRVLAPPLPLARGLVVVTVRLRMLVDRLARGSSALLDSR